ncbi:MAG: COQ9 family protein [Caulobacteraceae bacterium]|nr:COQ9 family protein [Caulobacteraceae bacterium]
MSEAGPDYAERAEAGVLEAALALAPAQGWTWPMTYAAGRVAGLSRGEVELLLPEGPRDLAALFSRRHDRAALLALADLDPAAMKVRERIRRAVRTRLEAALADAEAVRRWTGFLALPANLALAARLVWESADGLWRWAGDVSTDANHYSKRAILAEILASSLAIWLVSGEAEALAHLDRRIEAVMTFERLKAKVTRGGLGEGVANALGRVRYGLLRG